MSESSGVLGAVLEHSEGGGVHQPCRDFSAVHWRGLDVNFSIVNFS